MPVPSLADARLRCAEQLRRLPPALRALDASAGHSLEISERVQALAREADRHIAQQLARGDRP
jgi:hypothetical protein